MKDIKKLLEEKPTNNNYYSGKGETIKELKNKDLLKAVLPVLREIESKADYTIGHRDAGRDLLDFVENLLKDNA